ncbi:MAG TPA: MotA/TolQ/ExbB proton channel family protein [Pirellulaceae bacterium]|nr:MotA/TolQ/ExbB proton channel family protein [Pirellulaceae bacterium]
MTTWLGLVVAIPALIAFSYFRNKIDSIVAECGKRVERVLMPLSRKRM